MIVFEFDFSSILKLKEFKNNKKEIIIILPIP